MSGKDKQLVITVGTTKFNELIKNLDTKNFYEILDNHEFTSLIYQIGSGEYVPNVFKTLTLKNLKKIEVHRLMSNFEQVIKNSDFLISHCGAGTLLEALKNKKKVVVVVNDILMGNHQTELADELKNENYIHVASSISKVVEELESIFKKDNLKEYPDFNYDIIPETIYKMLEI